MKAPLTIIGLVAGAAAFGQFNDRPPLFPTPPVVGVPPAPLTNVGRTNLFTGTNAPFFSNQIARFTNGLRTNGVFMGRPPGFTNSAVGGFTNAFPPGAVVPDSRGITPDLPTVPGTPPTAPGVQPALPGNTPGLPGNTPGLPGGNPGLPGGTPGLPGGTPGLPGNTPGLGAPETGIVPRGSAVPVVPGTPATPPVPRKVPQAAPAAPRR